MKYEVVAILSVAACGLSTPETDRPKNLPYIAQTILKPSCGTAECHSAMNFQSGYAFDSVAATTTSLDRGLIVSCPSADNKQPPCENAAPGSYLFTILSIGVAGGTGAGDRMPLDQPLGESDIALIGEWINDGADGYGFPLVRQ